MIFFQVIKEEFAAEFKEKIGNKGNESFFDFYLLIIILTNWEIGGKKSRFKFEIIVLSGY